MLSPSKHPFYVMFVVVTDTVMIVASFASAYWLRFSNSLIPFRHDPPAMSQYLRAVFFILPIYFFIFRSYHLYQAGRHIRRVHELFNLAKAVTMSAVFVMALTFVYRDFSYSRLVLVIAWLLSIVYCSVGRYLLIQLEYYIRKKKDRHRVLIVGFNQSARNLINWARENPHYGQDVVGIISSTEGNLGKHVNGAPVLGTILDVNHILAHQNIHEVVVADPKIPKDTVTEIMLKCENMLIEFKLVADFYGLMTHYVDVEYVSNVPLLGLKGPPLDDPWNRLIKRVFDVSLSFSALVLLAPLFAVLVILLKLTSKGSVFYTQERIGRDGKCFFLYKFRTMTPEAENKTGPTWAQPNDPRTTKVGRFLRRFNLDELPQLWNVLVGDMSLVGPRPERPHFVERFRDQIPRYMTRHKIKSGLTGWAQIHGLRGNTSLEERIKYDLYYMENWTLMMDIEILFATLFAYKNAY